MPDLGGSSERSSLLFTKGFPVWTLRQHLRGVYVCAQSCPTLCDPVGCSPLDSSVPGILQERTLGRVPFPPPGHLPDPGMEAASPASAGTTYCVTLEAPGEPVIIFIFLSGAPNQQHLMAPAAGQSHGITSSQITSGQQVFWTALTFGGGV